MPVKPCPYRNYLLQGLSNDDLQLLSRRLEPVELTDRQELEKPGRPVTHVYFPESGIVSVVARGPRQRPLEIGLVGREGMTGLVVLLGDGRAPYNVYMQLPGYAHRIDSDSFRSALRESSTLREELLCYTQAYLAQTAFTAVSNANGKLEERLARWLLMAHDRVDGDELPLVHEFLAFMLGVRRAGVTLALQRLDQLGLVEVARGRVVVLDRDGLKEAANAAYGKAESEYARLLKRPIRTEDRGA